MESARGAVRWQRNIAFFLTGQAVSLIGSSLVGYAIMWYVILKTGSGTMMTAFTVAIMLPMFFISPFGGVWADRFNRKNLINIADGFIAAVTLVIAVSFAFGNENLWFLLLCSVARSFGQGVQMPAVSALIPQVVPSESLMRVNGINMMIQSVSMLGTPALAGAILSFFPIQSILFIDVVTATFSILILIIFVRVPNPGSKVTGSRAVAGADDQTDADGAAVSAAPEKRPMLADLKEGVRYIAGHAFLKRFFIIQACFVFLLAPAALLTPLQVTRNFGADVWRLSVIEIAFSAGMAAGGLLMTTWGGFKNRTYTIAASFLLMGAMSVGLGVTRVFVVYCVFMAFVGITAASGNTPVMTILQQKIEPAYMGRVFSVMTMISSIGMPLGMVVFGPLSDRVSLDAIIIVTGACTAAIGVYLFIDKVLIEAGRPEVEKSGTL